MGSPGAVALNATPLSASWKASNGGVLRRRCSSGPDTSPTVASLTVTRGLAPRTLPAGGATRGDPIPHRSLALGASWRRPCHASVRAQGAYGCNFVSGFGGEP